MKTLEQNIIHVWGDKGKLWFNQLPAILTRLSEYWNLSNINPVDNMSYNYVAKAIQKNNRSIVLKISCDKQLIEDEYSALKYFNGKGSIKALDIHNRLNALLLEQAIPGDTLKSNRHNDIKNTIEIYANVAKTLASQCNLSNQYTHVKKWCKAIDRMNEIQIEANFINKAKRLRDFLLSSAEKEYLCHGDLHLENIIHHENKWLSIDPKGIIGEIAFEAAAFDLINKSEWSEPEIIQDKIVIRINLLANTLEINKDRLLAWIFLRVILSAQWFIEDNGNPDEMLNLVAILYPLLTQTI